MCTARRANYRSSTCSNAPIELSKAFLCEAAFDDTCIRSCHNEKPDQIVGVRRQRVGKAISRAQMLLDGFECLGSDRKCIGDFRVLLSQAIDQDSTLAQKVTLTHKSSVAVTARGRCAQALPAYFSIERIDLCDKLGLTICCNRSVRKHVHKCPCAPAL